MLAGFACSSYEAMPSEIEKRKIMDVCVCAVALGFSEALVYQLYVDLVVIT